MEATPPADPTLHWGNLPSMTQSTTRFSSRVENYIRYRPRYPQTVIACLQHHCQLTETAVIADIGSGTGILTELFLQNGNRVYGVEPNPEMREAGARLLQTHERFTSVAGTAEATTLAATSVDFVTAGQAFHWFDPAQTRVEFQRILKPAGWVVLVWNERREVENALGEAYEQLLYAYAPDYGAVTHKRIDEDRLRDFFGGDFQSDSFHNSQYFDYAGLKGRLLSSSYTPQAGEPHHAPMLAELQQLFDRYQIAGQVVFDYDTRVYYGHLQER